MRDYKFGDFITQLRMNSGLSQSELGEKIGVSNRAVSKWENGAAKPRLKTLHLLAEVFGITVDELINCNLNSQSPNADTVDSSDTRANSRLWKLVMVIAAAIACLVAVVILRGVWTNADGEYTDEQLRDFMQSEAAKAIGVENDASVFDITNRFYNHKDMMKAEQIVLCGNYIKGYDENWTGRFLFIFEKIPTRARGEIPYKITYSAILRDDAFTKDILQCEDCKFSDIDGDGINEIMVAYRSLYATRVEQGSLILQRDGEAWRTVAPDLSTVQKDVTSEYGEDARPLLDEIAFECQSGAGKTTGYLYTLSHGGTVAIMENPFFSGCDWLYLITVNDGSTDMLSSDRIACVMMRVTDHGMFREPNWNAGELLFLPKGDEQLWEKVEALWGVNIDGNIAFGSDIE